MKKTFLILMTALCVNSYGQTIDLTERQTNIVEVTDKKTIIVTPSNGDNTSGPLQRMDCKQGPGAWGGDGCYHIGIYCSNGSGLSISIEIKNCASSFIGLLPELSNTPKNKLIDLEIGFVESTISNQGNINELQKFKSASYVVEQDAIYKGKDGNIIIKAGEYKVTNSKMHTSISVQ